jgi:hypothetical protein
MLFEEQYVQSPFSEQPGGRQPAYTGTDNDNIIMIPNHSIIEQTHW